MCRRRILRHGRRSGPALDAAMAFLAAMAFFAGGLPGRPGPARSEPDGPIVHRLLSNRRLGFLPNQAPETILPATLRDLSGTSRSPPLKTGESPNSSPCLWPRGATPRIIRFRMQQCMCPMTRRSDEGQGSRPSKRLAPSMLASWKSKSIQTKAILRLPRISPYMAVRPAAARRSPSCSSRSAMSATRSARSSSGARRRRSRMRARSGMRA
jgi:hypothetical protein